ncbi:hypothetical protein PENTCL1PPCAC_20808, partial [Pristionchus entomophagus]
QSKLGALQTTKMALKFHEFEKLTKPFVCAQVENGTLLYFDNLKPFELFTMIDGTRHNADLSPLEGESDCSFKGVIGNHAYFRSIRGQIIKFFRATVENEQIDFEKINEMTRSEISLFKHQPFYFVELSREWAVYHYYENHTEEGEKFVNHLSKYDQYYHSGILYLFREHSNAFVEKVNEKVVIVEGPLIDPDVISFYTPPHSDSIYIANSDQNVLLVLNTINLYVSQISYEPPADSTNHSFVGIHNDILTMAFDGVWG